MKIVVDTNIVLYYLGGRLLEFPPAGNRICLSVVSEIELLSYSKITEAEERRIRQFIAASTIIGISQEVKVSTIEIRRRYKLKLPDAIICATAFALGASLLTNDVLLKKVSEIQTIPVPLRPSL